MNQHEASHGRLQRLRDALEGLGIDALAVRDTSNIAWLSAFDDVFDAEQAHLLLVDAQRAVLHTDSRYALACRAAGAGGPVDVDDAAVTHVKWLAQAAAAIPHAGEKSLRLGIEDTITLAEFRKLEAQLADAEVAPVLTETNDVVLGLRAVKDAAEVARLKAAQAITDAAFAHIVGFMKPGVTERQVQVELDDYLLRHGATALAFPSIVACGPNGANPHAKPGDTPLQAGQCVVMDFGACAQGYCSDMTRMVFVGQPSQRLRDAYAVLRHANESVEAMLKPGVTGAQAHQHALDVLEQGGFGDLMGHGLGHGVGIDVHESPVLAPRNKQALVAGNVVTVEPGIYVEGEFGMRLEDFGIVTEDGFEVFTGTPHDMVVV